MENYLKDWDEHSMFWTLDLNSTRYVVKAFAGKAQGGMRYLYWAGPGKDFEEKPLALSFISTPQPVSESSTARKGMSFDWPSFLPNNRKRNTSTYSSDSSESTDSPEISVSESEGNPIRAHSLTQHGVDAGPGIPLWQTYDSCTRAMGSTNVLTQPAEHYSIPTKKRRSEISNIELDSMYSVTPPVERRSGEDRPGPTQPTREETKKKKYKTRIENQLDREFDQIFTPWAGDDQDVSRNTLIAILKVIDLMKDSSPQNITRTLNRALNGGTGKREDTGGRRPAEKCFKDLEAKLKSTKTRPSNGGTTNVHSSSSANPQPLNHLNLQRINVKTRQAASSDPQSTRLNGNRQQPNRDQDLDMSPPTNLSRPKQDRTTLIVRVAPSVEYQPVKLRRCMALQLFHTEVLGAWGVGGESVAKITVTFTWKDQTDPMRTVVMNSSSEDCFAHLVKQVDKAPGWEESDKEHMLDVEIVLKE